MERKWVGDGTFLNQVIQIYQSRQSYVCYCAKWRHVSLTACIADHYFCHIHLDCYTTQNTKV